MLFCLGIDKVKKSSLLIVLLMQSMVLQAEPVDISSAKLDDLTGRDNKEQRASPQYPYWSASRQINTVMVPPPPPGPYKSLAWDDFSVNQPSFANDSMRSVSKSAPTEVPMDVFSPDVPWPENLRPVKRWVPENGYRYAPPQLINKPYPVTQDNLPSNYKQGYRRSSDMSWTDSRWIPAMGANSGRSYRYAPAIRPGYGETAYTAPYPSVGQP